MDCEGDPGFLVLLPLEPVSPCYSIVKIWIRHPTRVSSQEEISTFHREPPVLLSRLTVTRQTTDDRLRATIRFPSDIFIIFPSRPPLPACSPTYSSEPDLTAPWGI